MNEFDIELTNTDEATVIAKRKIPAIPEPLAKIIIFACVAAGIFATLVWIGAWCWLLMRALIFLL